jgi:hypothetical protein
MVDADFQGNRGQRGRIRSILTHDLGSHETTQVVRGVKHGDKRPDDDRHVDHGLTIVVSADFSEQAQKGRHR